MILWPLVVLVLGALLIWRAEPLIGRVIAIFERRQLTVPEHLNHQVAPVLVEEPTTPDPIPADLLQIALNESEPWAKESVMKVLYETYTATRDWNQVRLLVGSVSPRNGEVS